MNSEAPMEGTLFDYVFTVQGGKSSSSLQIEPPLSLEHKVALNAHAGLRHFIPKFKTYEQYGRLVDRIAVQPSAGTGGADNDWTGAHANFDRLITKAMIIKSILERNGVSVSILEQNNIGTPPPRNH